MSSQPAAAHTAGVAHGGKVLAVPAVVLNGRTVITTGTWLRRAEIMDDELLEGESVTDLDQFVAALKAMCRADIFTFAQKFPDTTPRWKQRLEWDNVAVVPITTLADWLQHRVAHDARKAVNR